MKKKIVSILIIISAIIAILFGSMISYAKTADKPLKVNLQKKYANGVGYGFFNPGQQGKYIWRVVSYDSNDSAEQRNLYCVKAEYGNTWNANPSQKLTYDLQYDFQADRDFIEQSLKTDPNGVVAKLIQLEGGQYEQLLWLFDNMYIPNVTNKDAFLEKIGILKDAQGYYKIVNNYQVDVNSILTDDDIDAIQRVAIWKFTNSDVYTLTPEQTLWLNVITGQDEYGEDVYSDLRGIDADRNEQANLLYRYLITSAETAAQNGEYDNYQTNGNKITIDTQNLKKEGESYVLSTKLVNGKYLTGPIKITAENDENYEIQLSVTSNDTPVDFKYAKPDGTIIENAKLKDLVGTEFYINTDANALDKLSISISVVYEKTTKTLWLAGEEQTNAQTGNTEIVLDGEQPVVEITKKISDPEITNFIVKPFDLALRKYITSVKSGETITPINTRIPNYGDLSALRNGTTAEYKHRKDPVEVKKGDIVTYTIAIYNEGSKAGYASKIIDQLPVGLFMSTTHANGGTVISKDIEGNPVNTYTIEWDKITNPMNYQNQIKLTIADPANAVSLDPYTTGTRLDGEFIEVQCIVDQEPAEQTDTILTNVAWISEAYDSEAEKAISSEGTLDRDSQPQNSPDVKMDNMESYKGNADNKNELGDSAYHYEGEQDDDDFEKLILKADPKVFDLALVKFIIAVSDDETITEDEYLKEADGTYSREPEVKVSVDGKITYDFTNRGEKNPLVVEPGDYVLYTIRVYNEGEVDGYASKIKDILPDGLEFVRTNKTYNGIWDIDEEQLYGNDMMAITTDWYGKGKSYETLLTAFDKESAISEQNPDYLDAVVLCRVDEEVSSGKVLVNFAQISEDTDKDGNDIDDKDSIPDNDIPGDNVKEDDEDFEKVTITRFDLSLRKFISSVNGDQPTVSREPIVDTTPLKQKTSKNAIYKHPKTPVAVDVGDSIIYTIRIYNEGDINGYATEIKDYLPPYLKYVDLEDSETNTYYKWQISEDGRVATTRYLENTELGAFGTNTTLDYADVKIECILVEETPTHQNQTNIAEIAKYKYKQNEGINDSDSIGDSMEDMIPADQELPKYKNDEINKPYVPGNEDDDDFEKVYVKQFDLSLRKFISSVNGVQPTVSREPIVDTTLLKQKTSKNAIYNHPKTPLAVNVGDSIIYTIRIYNEGEIDGYATEIKDYLPPYLKYVDSDKSEINKTYKWQISEDGRVVTTRYLENTELKAFETNTTLDYADVKIECIVVEETPTYQNQTNIAEIAKYKYNQKETINDSDSIGESMEDMIPTDQELPKYKDDEINKPYVPGNEDDDDFEKIYVKKFDLALRKFITKIQDKEVTTRVPQVDISPLNNGGNTATYTHSKDALIVHVGDVVIYTLRIYNEGQLNGYAAEITDDIPEYLEYIPENATNVEYMWKMYDKNGNETENISEAISVKTEYLSKENGEDNLIKAFDGKTLDYKDIQIAFKVKDPNSNTYIITNHAQISEDTNENGKTIKDNDSDTETWNEGEDDQDIENIKVQYFDLSIVKFVSKVIMIEDGKQTITETGYNGHENPEPVVKVELHKKKLDNVIVKFGYGITVTNEGDIPGYATELTDYVPEGLKFESADNPEWTDEGNNVISTRQIEDKLLQPGESATVEVIFTWINSKDNLAQKTNTVEISEDKNEYDVPDRDSTPDNKKEGEDDIDIAEVILAISTGAIKTYFALTLGLLTIILAGVILIKKFVI